MTIQTTNINNRTLRELFEPCRTCVYWERPDQFRPPRRTEETKKFYLAQGFNSKTGDRVPPILLIL